MATVTVQSYYAHGTVLDHREALFEKVGQSTKSGPKYNSIPISGPKYSSDVDQSSDHIFRLADKGFLLVPHSNYGSICYRLATIGK